MKGLLISAVLFVFLGIAIAIGVHGTLRIVPQATELQPSEHAVPWDASVETSNEETATTTTPESNEEVTEIKTETSTSVSGTPLAPHDKEAITTMFWVGEGATAENDFISNSPSYWDEGWQKHFGGVDTPECRDGYYPCEFIPKENPFYVALPYGEYSDGELKPEAVPYLPLKNRWVKVTYRDTTCYGQWEDVGPNNENDFAYVFGSAQNPTNTFGAEAGLDVSPALWDCLGMKENDVTRWEFIPVGVLPKGPWKEIVTY